jgi:DNA-binding response OmpR family regulator
VNRPAILVVDDDRDLVELVAWILEEEGYEVRTAGNGAQGLQVLGTFDPALIILDMRMPVMDGWRFAAELDGRGPHAPILVMTAAEDAHVPAQEIGARYWIAKPFEIEALLRLVRAVAGPPAPVPA